MSDLQVSVGGDFQELLRGFQQLEQRAQQAGDKVGRGLAEGIQGFSSKSIAALQNELSRLQSRQTRVAVDSTAFEKTGQRIREVQALLDEVQRRKLTINADPASIDGLNIKLGQLRTELDRTAIGSARFRELQAAIKETEAALDQATESADDFRILDGVIQGVAFSLSNALVDAAGSALASLGQVISEFGRLDTEIRKAAAAGGEQGGYEKLSRSIDQVGIEAAGTQLEVAQLATELVRGGMTIDQVDASLGAIVRGAEATGTGFAQMGEVVSASLKGFGLAAKDSQRVVDALVTGANASATSVSGMGMAFKYAAPVAKILGVSIEELGIAVGLMTNAGIDASEAGVTLRNGLSKLASAAPQAGGSMQNLTGQAAEAAKAMRSLGINIYEADGTLKPMEGTLLQLKGAFDKLGPSSKIRLAANLFGGEDDGTKWLALLNQSEAEIKKMAATMANTKGATDTARDAMQGFELKIAQLTGTLGSLGNTFGSVAAAALLPFIDLANTLIGVVAALPTPIKQGAAAITLLAGAAVAATTAYVVFQKVMAMGVAQKAIADVLALAGAIKANLAAGVATAAAMWAKFTAALMASSFAGAVTGLQQIAAGLRALNAQQAVAGFQQLAATLRLVAVQAKAALAGQIVASVAALRGALGNAAIGASLLGNSLRQTAAASQAAQAGLSGAALLLQQGMTQGAGAAAASATGLSKVLAGLAGLTGGQVVVAFKAFAAVMLPLAAAIGGVVAVVASYNAIMGKATAANEAGWKAVDRHAESLKAAGIQFQDFRSKGGPVEEALARLRGGFDDLTKKMREIPVIGPAVAAALQGALQGIPVVALTIGIQDLVKSWKLMQAEAAKNQAIVEVGDVLAQMEEQLGVTSEKVVKFTETLRNSSAGGGAALDVLTDAYENVRAQAVSNVDAATDLAAAYDLQANAARAAGDTELADRLASAAKQMQANIQLETIKLNQLDEEAAKRGIVAKKTNEQQVGIATLITRVLSLNAALAQRSGEIEVLQAVIGLSNALVDVEQSRLGIVRGRAQFELDQAQKRGASERELAQLRANIDQLDQQALQAKYNALIRQQELEAKMLTLRQASQRLEADQTAINAKIALEQAVLQLKTAQEKKDQAAIDNATIEVNKAQGAVKIAENKRALLNQIQPIEQQIAAATNESAANSIKAEAATRGWNISTRDVSASATATKGVIDKTVDSIDNTTDGFKDSAAAAKQTSDAAGKVGSNAASSAKQAVPLATALDSAGESANVLATARMAENLSRASGSVGGITKAMAAAVTYAKQFLDILSRASALPGSRWTGGDVEAGSAYRINELGQEAFLSAGRLSLINAAPNSIWRAPTSGTVIPAGITETLKARGAFGAKHTSGSAYADQAAVLASQAVALGKLQQSVDRLVAKDWNIHVKVRSDSGASHLNALNRIR